MKRTKILLLVAASLILIEVPVETMASVKAAKEVTVIGGRKRKAKGYRPKRGGLFNTGLFRKKNPCGCPNH